MKRAILQTDGSLKIEYLNDQENDEHDSLESKVAALKSQLNN